MTCTRTYNLPKQIPKVDISNSYINPLTDNRLLQLQPAELRRNLLEIYSWLSNVDNTFRSIIEGKSPDGIIVNIPNYNSAINNIAISVIYLSTIDYAKDKLNLIS